jgi:hypothetical protein
MPAKSKKQFKMMGVLYQQGKISRTTLQDFNKGVNYKKLPNRVKKSK